MNWNDSGFLLSKNKYNENSVIAEVFTENYGKRSGLIFGASSKKIKNYLEIGNKLTINNYNIAVDIASFPDQIRGFGHVKKKNIKIAEDCQSNLIATFNEAK